MARDGCNCFLLFFFHCRQFFALLNPIVAQKNQDLKKMKTNSWRYHRFTHTYQKLSLDDARFLRYGARWMDGRKEKVTYRGGYPT